MDGRTKLQNERQHCKLHSTIVNQEFSIFKSHDHHGSLFPQQIKNIHQTTNLSIDREDCLQAQ